METFEDKKTIKELGVDPTRKFLVVDDNEIGGCRFEKGDILILKHDDDDSCPYFKRLSDGKTEYCALFRLAYYEEEKTWDNLTAGDPIWDQVGNKRIILDEGKHGNVFCLSARGDNMTSGLWLTKKELQKYGFTIVQPKKEKQVEEEAIKLLESRGRIKDGKVIV